MTAFGLGGMLDEIRKGNCPFCLAPIFMSQFKNEISKREFKISGLCQKCQDKTFGGD